MKEYPQQESNGATLSVDGVKENENRPTTRGAQTGAPKQDSGIPTAIDADLARLIAAWPRLPESTRSTIRMLVESVERRTQ